jgi:nucleotide-binding universal stress UspA family protein
MNSLLNSVSGLTSVARHVTKSAKLYSAAVLADAASQEAHTVSSLARRIGSDRTAARTMLRNSELRPVSGRPPAPMVFKAADLNDAAARVMARRSIQLLGYAAAILGTAHAAAKLPAPPVQDIIGNR